MCKCPGPYPERLSRAREERAQADETVEATRPCGFYKI